MLAKINLQTNFLKLTKILLNFFLLFNFQTPKKILWMICQKDFEIINIIKFIIQLNISLIISFMYLCIQMKKKNGCIFSSKHYSHFEIAWRILNLDSSICFWRSRIWLTALDCKRNPCPLNLSNSAFNIWAFNTLMNIKLKLLLIFVYKAILWSNCNT